MIKKITIFALIAFSMSSYAQESTELDQENLYEKELKTTSPSLLNQEIQESDRETPRENLKSLVELQKLAPFEDVAVIQKRFLPKTERFEFFPNIGFIANNAFFLSSYFQGRFGYAFSEKWAIEAIAAIFTDSKYKVTKDIEGKQVKTENLIIPESYYGLDIRWTPFYGKMGFFTDSIIPFDMYFSLGAGVTGTNEDTNPFTIHAGTGQIYAIKKWMAFRWDLSMYYYTSETQVGIQTGQPKREDTFTDIQISIGMSFFFPEASYR